MRLLIVANWKMNPSSQAEAKRLFNSVKNGTKKIKNVETVICSPFVFMSNMNKFLASESSARGGSAFGGKNQKSNIKLGAQNCFWEERGAYTGEISALMLKSLNCQYVIIGHSERRKYFAETDEIVNKKLKAVLDIKLSPILCIGETKEERDKEETEAVLRRQTISALKNISSSKFSKITIAYEPVWAIGTGDPCDIEEAQKMGLLIRKIISELYNRAISERLRILYGGSANSKNAASYIKEARFQGLLVGGASLIAEEFIKVIKTVS